MLIGFVVNILLFLAQICAFAYHVAKSFGEMPTSSSANGNNNCSQQEEPLIDDSGPSNLFGSRRPLITALVLFGSVVGLCAYILFALHCPSKIACNEVHTYLTFVPIVSFALLRNTIGALRTRFSSLFAALGRISLELFVAQYHIWLAQDTHGVLVLVPGAGRVLNYCLSGFVFVCAAHEINAITRLLQRYFLPECYDSAAAERRALLRRCALFAALLLLVASAEQLRL